MHCISLYSDIALTLAKCQMEVKMGFSKYIKLSYYILMCATEQKFDTHCWISLWKRRLVTSFTKLEKDQQKFRGSKEDLFSGFL